MSRIYEALKKAEEERAPTGFAEELKPVDSVDAGSTKCAGAARQAPSIVSTPARGNVPASGHYLRLDELGQRCATPAWKLDPEKNIFCNEHSFAAGVEQFHTLRSRLYRLREKQPLRIVLVTSTLPNEGKTFVALNLAQAIARQHERRALLIDADLRASTLHIPMGAPSWPGLADYLRGEADEFSIIQANPQNNLFFIPAGRSISNPAELLSNNLLKGLLDRLAPIFDWVILDAPPVLPVSDASVLAGLCDGVLFVVRAASTAFDLAQTACREFREKNLVGVVLNRAEERVTYGAYSYYGENGKDKR
jgi:capsular exopolysaccharide synthesis family protein